jgi:hypothetical protein
MWKTVGSNFDQETCIPDYGFKANAKNAPLAKPLSLCRQSLPALFRRHPTYHSKQLTAPFKQEQTIVQNIS